MRMSEQAWHLVKDTPRVIGFIGNQKPREVPSAEIESMRRGIVDGTVKPKPRLSFSVGEEVRVLDGAFANFTGTVDGEEDVAGTEDLLARAAVGDAGHEHAAEAVLDGGGQAERAAMGGALELLGRSAQGGEALVDGVVQGLEGDAHQRAVVDDGAAAVARVDGGVDLHREELAVALLVGDEIDAGHDALGHAEPLTADGVAADAHPIAERREVANHDGGGALEEGRVVHPQQGEVALVAQPLHLGLVAAREAEAPHLDEDVVGHAMRVGEDAGAAAGLDDGARAAARGRAL